MWSGRSVQGWMDPVQRGPDPAGGGATVTWGGSGELRRSPEELQIGRQREISSGEREEGKRRGEGDGDGALAWGSPARALRWPAMRGRRAGSDAPKESGGEAWRRGRAAEELGSGSPSPDLELGEQGRRGAGLRAQIGARAGLERAWRRGAMWGAGR